MIRSGARGRRVRSDELGLRRGLADRMLPFLVGAMAFLAALALAGVVGAAGLSAHWRQGAAASLTVQVPDPEVEGRLGRVLEAIRGTPGVVSARALSEAEMEALLRPWLGSGAGRIAVPLPGVVAVQVAEGSEAVLAGLGERLPQVAAGTLVETQDVWIQRLSALAWSLQASAGLAMGVVGVVAVAVVMVATWAGLASRRATIEVVHGLGATDGFIAGRFSRRATRLAFSGAVGGMVLAVPVLVGLAGLAAPFVEGGAGTDELGSVWGMAAAVPARLWLGVPLLPVLAGAIGWVTAQTTVRRWLRRLP